MIHDPLCTHERHNMCICGELRTARIEERARILKDDEDGKSYRMGRLDAAYEVMRIANQIPQGSEYDPIWTALSAAVDVIQRGVKRDDKDSSNR
jgi:hypothetical protein